MVKKPLTGFPVVSNNCDNTCKEPFFPSIVEEHWLVCEELHPSWKTPSFVSVARDLVHGKQVVLDSRDIFWNLIPSVTFSVEVFKPSIDASDGYHAIWLNKQVPDMEVVFMASVWCKPGGFVDTVANVVQGWALEVQWWSVAVKENLFWPIICWVSKSPYNGTEQS